TARIGVSRRAFMLPGALRWMITCCGTCGCRCRVCTSADVIGGQSSLRLLVCQRTRGLGAARPWQEHPHLAPVLPVALAEAVHEIALFERDADEDVGGGGQCEHQMAE